MKKKITACLMMLLCVITALAGCGAPSEGEQAMEQILAANTTAALLEQYENITLFYEFSDGSTAYTYVDKDTYLFTDESHYATSLYTPREQCEAEVVDGTEYIHRHINPFDADLGAAYRESAFLIDNTEKETVASFREEAGVLHVETRLAAEDMSQEEMEYMGILMKKGEYYACEYKADAKTYHILSSDEYIMRADGTREEIGRVTIQGNTDRPDYIAEMEAKCAAIDDLSADQVRVITCVVDPGLESERTVSKTVKKGSYVIFPEDMQGYGIYMDPEGSQSLAEASGLAADGDYTVYLIKEA